MSISLKVLENIISFIGVNLDLFAPVTASPLEDGSISVSLKGGQTVTRYLDNSQRQVLSLEFRGRGENHKEVLSSLSSICGLFSNNIFSHKDSLWETVVTGVESFPQLTHSDGKSFTYSCRVQVDFIAKEGG